MLILTALLLLWHCKLFLHLVSVSLVVQLTPTTEREEVLLAAAAAVVVEGGGVLVSDSPSAARTSCLMTNSLTRLAFGWRWGLCRSKWQWPPCVPPPQSPAAVTSRWNWLGVIRGSQKLRQVALNKFGVVLIADSTVSVCSSVKGRETLSHRLTMED